MTVSSIKRKKPFLFCQKNLFIILLSASKNYCWAEMPFIQNEERKYLQSYPFQAQEEVHGSKDEQILMLTFTC